MLLIHALEIEEDPNKVINTLQKEILVAVITNGTAVLGLGDIGPEASKPVMEGKHFFKIFAGIDVLILKLTLVIPKNLLKQ